MAKKPDTVSSASGWPDGSGKHWADMMPDGYARGFVGDSSVMRAQYRTPAALLHKNPGNEGQTLVEQFWNRENAATKKRLEDREPKAK